MDRVLCDVGSRARLNRLNKLDPEVVFGLDLIRHATLRRLLAI